MLRLHTPPQLLEIVALFLVASSTSTGFAELIAVDDPFFGAESITRDTETELDWLDVTLSVGSSYNEIEEQFGPDGDFRGFRFATKGEIEMFFYSSAGISDAVPREPSIPEVTDLQLLVGVTFTTFDGVKNTFGFYDDSNTGTDPALAGSASLAGGPISSNSAVLFNDSRSKDATSSLRGGWLVRPSTDIPEPASMFLAGLGAVAMLSLRNRLRASPRHPILYSTLLYIEKLPR